MMAGHKGIGDGIESITKDGEKTRESGRKMLNEADQISSIMQEIEVVDEQDKAAVEGAKDQYQPAFDKAFESDVTTKANETERQGKEIVETATQEREGVNEGIHKLEQAAGVSEIGREGAEAARGRLETSSREYTESIEQAQAVIAEMQGEVNQLRNALGSKFKK